MGSVVCITVTDYIALCHGGGAMREVPLSPGEGAAKRRVRAKDGPSSGPSGPPSATGSNLDIVSREITAKSRVPRESFVDMRQERQMNAKGTAIATPTS